MSDEPLDPKIYGAPPPLFPPADWRAERDEERRRRRQLVEAELRQAKRFASD